MTTIAVATTRGADLPRLADVLAAFYSLLKRVTYVEPLHEGEASLFPPPPDTEAGKLTHVPLVGSDPIQMNQGIVAAIRQHKTEGGTTIVSLPSFAQHL